MAFVDYIPLSAERVARKAALRAEILAITAGARTRLPDPLTAADPRDPAPPGQASRPDQANNYGWDAIFKAASPHRYARPQAGRDGAGLPEKR